MLDHVMTLIGVARYPLRLGIAQAPDELRFSADARRIVMRWTRG
jgi:hypothetical protein